MDAPIAIACVCACICVCLGAALYIDRAAVKELLFEPSAPSLCGKLRFASWLSSLLVLVASSSYAVRVASHPRVSLLVSADATLACMALLHLVIQFGLRAVPHMCWSLSGGTIPPVGKADAASQPGTPSLVRLVGLAISGVVALGSAAVPVWYLAMAGIHLVSTTWSAISAGTAGSSSWAQGQATVVAPLVFIVVALALAWLRERTVAADLASKVEELQRDDVRANERDRMRLLSYPDTFPTSWYRVCSSDDVKPGQTKTVRMLGLELVVFRGESGVASVLGAFCPHLGAHLGVGGRVVGDCLECPFHRWQFDTDGGVAHIPYCDAPPTGNAAKALHYHTREYYGWIVMWYDAEDPGNAKNAPPHYEPPRVPDIEDGTLVFRGTTSPPDVRMHIQEFAENSADPQHFQPLHDRAYFPYTSTPIPFMEVVHGARWEGPAAKMGSSEGAELVVRDEPGEDGKRLITFAGPMIAEFKDSVSVRVFGRDMEQMRAKADITFVGPGAVSFFRFDIPQVGRIHMFQAMTPRGLMRQHVDFRFFAPKHVPSVLVHYVVGNWIENFRADIDVWENKIFLPRPLLAKGDGPIMRMRAWTSQFYAKGRAKRAIAIDDASNGRSGAAAAAEKAPEPVKPHPQMQHLSW